MYFNPSKLLLEGLSSQRFWIVINNKQIMTKYTKKEKNSSIKFNVLFSLSKVIFGSFLNFRFSKFPIAKKNIVM